MAKTAQQIREKWQRSMNAAQKSMADGVDAMTENPMELAAAAQDRYARGVQEAVESGKFRDGCLSVSPQTWKDRYKKKGIPRVAEGVAQAAAVVDAFHAWHQPICEAAKSEARNMRAQGADGRAIMNANYDRMKGLRFQRPRT